MRVFCCHRTFHEENENNEREGDYGKNEKGLDLIEVRIHGRIERIEIFAESIGMINKSLVSYALGAGHLCGQCLKLGIELFGGVE